MSLTRKITKIDKCGVGGGGAPSHGFHPRVLLLALSHTVNGVSLPPTSLLASGRRPITALTTADQENLDQLCFVFVSKLVARAMLELRIASFNVKL